MHKRIIPLLLAAALLFAACARTADTQISTIYGIVTDISGDTYTLALGELTDRGGTPNTPPDGAPSAAEKAAASAADSAKQSTLKNSSDSAITAISDTASDLLQRTGVTRTLHITDAAGVTMLVGDNAVDSDVSRIAVGHVIAVTLEESASGTAGVQRVEILG